jgi:hypothetical protein
MQIPRFRRASWALGLFAVLVAGPSTSAEPTAHFAGLWQDCTSFPGTCYGYRLAQESARVCGSLTEAPASGDAPRRHGHIRGVVQGSLLTQVAVCGVESRSACPTVLASNRRGLLRCGDTMAETGGRRYTCEEWAAQKQPSAYQRVSAEAFNQRFGAAPPSLCEVAVTPEAGAPPPSKQ